MFYSDNISRHAHPHVQHIEKPKQAQQDYYSTPKPIIVPTELSEPSPIKPSISDAPVKSPSEHPSYVKSNSSPQLKTISPTNSTSDPSTTTFDSLNEMIASLQSSNRLLQETTLHPVNKSPSPVPKPAPNLNPVTVGLLTIPSTNTRQSKNQSNEFNFTPLVFRGKIDHLPCCL